MPVVRYGRKRKIRNDWNYIKKLTQFSGLHVSYDSNHKFATSKFDTLVCWQEYEVRFAVLLAFLP